jgi:hypothetical protein
MAKFYVVDQCKKKITTCPTLFATQKMSADVAASTLLRCGVTENQTCAKSSEDGRTGNGDKLAWWDNHVDESLRKTKKEDTGRPE